MNQTNTLMVAVLIALGVVLVAAFVADIATIHQEAQARKASRQNALRIPGDLVISPF